LGQWHSRQHGKRINKPIREERGVLFISIEDVARRNQLTLFKTSRPGQFKAHCPVCGDKGQHFHLYVSTNKDGFFCHKCGNRGGVVAFHAWLRGIDSEAAKAELYPPDERKHHRHVHPAETLTKAQLAELGFTLRKPHPPQGVPRKTWWKHHRKPELDWIWHEWCKHDQCMRQVTENLTRLLEEADREEHQTRHTSGATVTTVYRRDLRPRKPLSAVNH
jgi:hypothetical protein